MSTETVKYIVVAHDNLTEIAQDYYVTEASDLGINPGSFPYKMMTVIGNKHPLVVVKRSTKFVDYVQEHGTINVRVYNT